MNSDIARRHTAGRERAKPDACTILYMQDEKGWLSLLSEQPEKPSVSSYRELKGKK